MSEIDYNPNYTKEFLNSLKKTELDEIAKSFGIKNASKIRKPILEQNILKKNLSKMSKVTRIDKLPSVLKEKIYNKVFESKEKEFLEIIKEFFEKHDTSYLLYQHLYEYKHDYNKIRKKLKLRHYDKERDIIKKLKDYIDNIYKYTYNLGSCISLIENSFIESSDTKIHFIGDINTLKKTIDKFNNLSFRFKMEYNFNMKRPYIDDINEDIKKCDLPDNIKKDIPHLKFYGKATSSNRSQKITKAISLTSRKNKKTHTRKTRSI